MAVSNGYPYPGFTNPYVRGKLPPVKTQLNRKMCAGRIFIFLILGVVLFVLGLVSMGVYFNVNGSTSSTQYTEIMPLYITSGTIILAGLCVSVLFWRRWKIFVFLSVVICVATGFLCGITAVLTCTHVLQPLQTFRTCRYYMSQKLCQCFSPYRRDMLSLEYSDTEDTKYDFEDVLSCDVIQNTLPRLLYALVAVYGLVFIFCIGSAILALLVLRAERIKQRFLGDESYEEVYTVSGSSSQDQSDSEPEVATEVTTPQRGQTIAVKSSVPVAKNSLSAQGVSRDSSSQSVSQSVSSTAGSNKIGPVSSQNLSSQPTDVNSGQINQGQRSKTPGLNDFAKESLANRYKINKTPDRDLTVRQRLSKTPDREIGASRRHSFAASKRLSKSCDSLDSSGNLSRDIDGNYGTDVGQSKKKGKLKEHRRKGKRAATVHTLDTDQLLLILNLQMRYLQETRDQQENNSNTLQPGSRRAITPQPVSQRTIIPQKVRSHTPQPRRANQRTRDQVNFNTYPQNYDWNLTSQGAGNNTTSENSSRRTSESSERNFEVTNGQSSGKFVYNKGNCVGSESYLLAQQIHKTAPHIREGYNPYIHSQFQNNSADNVHFVTYSDSMLNNPPNKPKSRASVQNYFLPPQPIRRGTQGQLPPQPVSRQKITESKLPSQPVHRGSSAFHIVDRNSKSRSPSISNDRFPEKIESTPKRKLRKDYADVAIRENFSLNPKPFILKESQDIENATRTRNELTNQNQQKGNFMMRHEKYLPVENLPPYSGPPSYKEHVSSCNTSVTSSLSSNPDDVYSLPKRRVVTEQETPVRTNGSRNGQYIIGANIYENSEMNGSNNFQHPVRGHGQEIIYSSPAKSKVKQFIVPEDYYTQIGKVSREVADQRNEADRDKESIQRQVMENVYGNSTSAYGSGLQQAYNADFDGQIAPDAKYHEYEDVYDTPENVQDILPQKLDTNVDNMYSVNTQGMSYVKKTPKYKSKLRSPKKNNKSPYPVSNVHVNTHRLDFVDSDNINHNKQISDSVENVHAENVSRIPQIKLNDREVESANISDDDVFLNDDPKVNKVFGNKQKSNGGGSVFSEKENEIRENTVTKNQNYQEISDFDLSNENQEIGHMVSDFTNEETETGYMKMSLPGKSNGLPNFTQVVNQAAPISSNQNELSGHLTEVTNQNSRRQLPDGIENVSTEENEEFEETGV